MICRLSITGITVQYGLDHILLKKDTDGNQIHGFIIISLSTMEIATFLLGRSSWSWMRG